MLQRLQNGDLPHLGCAHALLLVGDAILDHNSLTRLKNDRFVDRRVTALADARDLWVALLAASAL